MRVDEPLINWVAVEEGFRAFPYRCPAGFLTIGYGTNLDAGVSREEASWLLEHRLRVVNEALDAALPWTRTLDPVRRGVLLALAYQLKGGVAGLLRFKATLRAFQRGDWEGAATHMLASKWARTDSPARARRTVQAVRTGQWPGSVPLLEGTNRKD